MSKKTQSNLETLQQAKDDIVLASLTLAALQGWDNAQLHDIAAEAKMSLADMRGLVSDKMDILIALGAMIDRKTLENAEEPDPESAPRDILFDILMDRFEVLNEYREGIISILNSFSSDPKQAVTSMPYLCRSMTWMLEAAGQDTSGFRGTLKVAGLSAVYLNVIRIWVKDDSPDLGKTMAALDKNLKRAEQAANTLGF